MIKGETVGEGTYGTVYVAYSEEEAGKSYVVKRNFVEREVDFSGTLRELDLLLCLKSHPCIVTLEKVLFGTPFSSGKLSPARKGYKDDNIHFVLEKAERDLHSYIYTPDVSFTSYKKMVVDALLGLEYMHAQGILHRDLKPANLLLFPGEGDTYTLKLCDFGLSKFYTLQEPSTPRMVTAWYRAPEIAMQRSYGPASDLWSMGCILYEMVTQEGFIHCRSDADRAILREILRCLPRRLPPAPAQAIKREFGVALPRGRRKRFYDEVFFSEKGKEKFRREVGSPEDWVDLLEHLLVFDPNHRYSAPQALAHPFFEDFQPYMAQIRLVHPAQRLESPPIRLFPCWERAWATNLAFVFYNQRAHLLWYTPRILFQAIDLFDRYLEQAPRTPLSCIQKPSRKILQKRRHIETRFIVCIYLSIKYFATLETPVSYPEISEELFSIRETVDFAENFEQELLQTVLHYRLYRPTLFEAADRFQDTWSERDLRNALMQYGHWDTEGEYSLEEFYLKIREKIRTSTIS